MESEHEGPVTKGLKRRQSQRAESDRCNQRSHAKDTDDLPMKDERATIADFSEVGATRSNSSKSRTALSREIAIEIYARRPDQMGFKKSRRGTMVSCEAVAVEFGVTPKTIRDIWRGRTWSEATGHPPSDVENRSVILYKTHVYFIFPAPNAALLLFIQLQRHHCPHLAARTQSSASEDGGARRTRTCAPEFAPRTVTRDAAHSTSSRSLLRAFPIPHSRTAVACVVAAAP